MAKVKKSLRKSMIKVKNSKASEAQQSALELRNKWDLYTYERYQSTIAFKIGNQPRCFA